MNGINIAAIRGQERGRFGKESGTFINKIARSHIYFCKGIMNKKHSPKERRVEKRDLYNAAIGGSKKRDPAISVSNSPIYLRKDLVGHLRFEVLKVAKPAGGES